MILNAKDLAEPKFACYMDHDFKPHQMEFEFNSVNNILIVRPKKGESLMFNHF